MRFRTSLMYGSLTTLGLLSMVHAESPSWKTLQPHVTLHASFDQGPDADFARGDRRIYSAPSFDERDKGKPGFETQQQTVLVPGAGLSGSSALRFQHAQSPILFFDGQKNVDYRASQWSGTASFWLRVDPQKELAPGFCDPIQITTRAWNDGAFFVDFDKDGQPRDIRLGAYADLPVWNPTNRPYEQFTPAELPLLAVKSPPFSSDHWTHLLFTWENFNQDSTDSSAKFYINGRLQGELTQRKQIFSWKADEAIRIFLGISYVGMLDELALFDRALTPAEVSYVHQAAGKGWGE